MREILLKVIEVDNKTKQHAQHWIRVNLFEDERENIENQRWSSDILWYVCVDKI